MDSSRSPSFGALFREISTGRVWLLYLTRIILFAGLFAMVPHLQTELTDYFVERHTDDAADLDCKGKTHRRHGHDDDDTPQACIDAHNDVLLWTTGRTLFTAFTLSFILNPAVGTLSDMYGRKPFLIFASLMQGIVFVAVFLYTQIDIPLYWYYPAYVVAMPFNPQTIYLAYISDVVSAENRLLAFGFMILTVPIGIVVGMTLVLSGVIGSLKSATIAGLVLCIVGAAIQKFFLPESLSQDLMHKARESVAEKSMQTTWKSSLSLWWSSTKESLKIVWRTSLFRKLTVTMLIVGTISEEYTDFRVQYLQEVIGFSTKQQSRMLMIIGVSGLLIMTVGLWIMRPVLKMTNKQIMIMGSALLTVSMVLLAAAKNALMAYLSTVLVSFWMPLAMAISTIKAENVEEELQGAVQGALSAVFHAGQGLGPLTFFALYYFFRSGSLYIPGAPFYFASALMFITFCFSFTLDSPETASITKAETGDVSNDEESALLNANDSLRVTESISQ